MNMEKKLSSVAYWIGIVCAAVALIARALALVGTRVFPALPPGKVELSYRSFLEGAMLFFVMAIASAVVRWAKTQRS
jgi:hypothetical protein